MGGSQVSEENSIIELESVTPRQFFEWLKANEHKTWSHGDNGGFSSKARENGGGPIFKYFRLNLDTRDMKIFNIETNSMHTSTDFRDKAPEGVKTLTDMLDHKAKEWKDEEHESKLKRQLMGRFPELDFDAVIKALNFLSHELLEKWWSGIIFDERKKGKEFDWNKQQFTYHEFKRRLTDMIESEMK